MTKELRFKVKWHECCGHYFPERICEETDEIISSWEDEALWKSLEDVEGTLVFIPDEEQE